MRKFYDIHGPRHRRVFINRYHLNCLKNKGKTERVGDVRFLEWTKYGPLKSNFPEVRKLVREKTGILLSRLERRFPVGYETEEVFVSTASYPGTNKRRKVIVKVLSMLSNPRDIGDLSFQLNKLRKKQELYKAGFGPMPLGLVPFRDKMILIEEFIPGTVPESSKVGKAKRWGGDYHKLKKALEKRFGVADLRGDNLLFNTRRGLYIVDFFLNVTHPSFYTKLISNERTVSTLASKGVILRKNIRKFFGGER